VLVIGAATAEGCDLVVLVMFWVRSVTCTNGEMLLTKIGRILFAGLQREEQALLNLLRQAWA
jgi:hypothetical protein